MRTAKQAVNFMKRANKRWSEENERIKRLEHHARWHYVPSRWIETAETRRAVAWLRFDQILSEHVHDPEFIELAGAEGLLDGIALEDYEGETT